MCNNIFRGTGGNISNLDSVHGEGSMNLQQTKHSDDEQM